MKPRLCIVNPYEHGGGAEYQIKLCIDALAASGRYEVSYLAHFLDPRDPVRDYRSVRVGSGGAMPRLGYLVDAPSLYRELSRIDPCLIYQRVACGYTGICAAYARRRSIPLVWHVAHDTDVSPQLLDAGRNFVRARLEKWAVNYGARHATRIIVQTEQQDALLQRNFARAADAIIPNFQPPASEIIDKSGPFTVLWIANLKLWKRPDAFVRLARGFGQNPRIRFVMVGAPAAKSGRQSWQQTLLREIGATPNLQYLGSKSQSEVNELLGRAHVLVNTSTQEGFPNTFIQAWLRDVAVVSLSVDPDRVLERKSVGIAAHSEAALAAAVRLLSEDPEARAGFVQRGRDHAAAHHSLRNVEKLVALLGGYSGRGG